MLGPVKLHNLFCQSGSNLNQVLLLEKKIKRGINPCIAQFHEPVLLKTLTTSRSDTQEAAGEGTMCNQPLMIIDQLLDLLLGHQESRTDTMQCN